eukprot:TRINITY_DN2899_c0_g1_i3.p1 TRINITY_DN2899_c0_g1~~TRINITY_DN2899_c0_g1_i3.p1  ORF type:complete len:2412 (-),score=767.99 TRINITY_DN2899_c0_g1_i3:29-7264(-)
MASAGVQNGTRPGSAISFAHQNSHTVRPDDDDEDSGSVISQQDEEDHDMRDDRSITSKSSKSSHSKMRRSRSGSSMSSGSSMGGSDSYVWNANMASGFFDSSKDSIVITTSTLIVTAVNLAAQHSLGYFNKELINTNFYSLIPEQHLKTFKAETEKFLQNGLSGDLCEVNQSYVERKDGNVFPATIRVSIGTVEDEKLITFIIHDEAEVVSMRNKYQRRERDLLKEIEHKQSHLSRLLQQEERELYDSQRLQEEQIAERKRKKKEADQELRSMAQQRTGVDEEYLTRKAQLEDKDREYMRIASSLKEQGRTTEIHDVELQRLSLLFQIEAEDLRHRHKAVAEETHLRQLNYAQTKKTKQARDAHLLKSKQLREAQIIRRMQREEVQLMKSQKQRQLSDLRERQIEEIEQLQKLHRQQLFELANDARKSRRTLKYDQQVTAANLLEHQTKINAETTLAQNKEATRMKRIQEEEAAALDKEQAAAAASLKARQDEILRMLSDRHNQDALSYKKQLEEQKHFEILAENCGDMISLHKGTNGIFRYCSPSCAALLGYNSDELKGHSFQEFIHPDHAEEVQKELEGFVRTSLQSVVRKVQHGQDVTVPGQDNTLRPQLFRLCRRDGTNVWVERTVKVMLSKIVSSLQHDNVEGSSPSSSPKPEDEYEMELLYVTRDVSQRVAMEETQRRTERMQATATTAAQVKRDFLAFIGHECRNPLNALFNITDFLADTSLDDQQRQYLTTIKQCSSDMLRILNDLLDLSKIEAGKIDIDITPFQMRGLVNEALRTMHAEAVKKGLWLKSAFDANVPDWIMCDPSRIRQILLNLIGNAIKFTERGGVCVSVDVQDTIDDICFLHTRVTDTGIGIEESAVAKLFSMYGQATASDFRKYGGTGIGLRLCSLLVQQSMGGTIGIESTKGEGTTLWFTLPLSIKTPADKPSTAHSGLSTGTTLDAISDPTSSLLTSSSSSSISTAVVPVPAPARVFRAPSARVLVVDDLSLNRDIAVTILSKAGCICSTANDGVDAVAVYKEKEFDLVLMDIQMPRMTGVEATYNIREVERQTGRTRTPIVAISGNVQPSEQAMYIQSGMDYFLAKPFKQSDFVSILTRFKLGSYANNGDETATPPPPAAATNGLVKSSSSSSVPTAIQQQPSRSSTPVHAGSSPSVPQGSALRTPGAYNEGSTGTPDATRTSSSSLSSSNASVSAPPTSAAKAVAMQTPRTPSPAIDRPPPSASSVSDTPLTYAGGAPPQDTPNTPYAPQQAKPRPYSPVTPVAPPVTNNIPTPDHVAPPLQSLKHVRVLVADASSADRTIYQKLLNQCDATIVARGEDALEEYDNNSFDVIVLDTNIEDMQAKEVVELIRRKEQLSNNYVSIVLVCSSPEEEEALRGCGASSCLIKGRSFVNRDVLLQALLRCVSVEAINFDNSPTLKSTARDSPTNVRTRRQSSDVGPAAPQDPKKTSGQLPELFDWKFIEVTTSSGVFASLLTLFLTSAQSIITNIHKFTSERDLRRLVVEAHNASTIGANLGAMKFSKVASVLRFTASRNWSDDIPGMVARLDVVYKETMDELMHKGLVKDSGTQNGATTYRITERANHSSKLLSTFQAEDLGSSAEIKSVSGISSNGADVHVLKPTRVLVVDDVPMNQFIVNSLLSQNQFQCDVTSSGSEAIEMFTRHPYDLILMDIYMGAMSGTDATKQIREMEKHPNFKRGRVPVVALTSVAATERKYVVKKLRQAGVDDLVLKPVLRNNLLNAIEIWRADTKDSFRLFPVLDPAVVSDLLSLEALHDSIGLLQSKAAALIDLLKIYFDSIGARKRRGGSSIASTTSEDSEYHQEYEGNIFSPPGSPKKDSVASKPPLTPLTASRIYAEGQVSGIWSAPAFELDEGETHTDIHPQLAALTTQLDDFAELATIIGARRLLEIGRAIINFVSKLFSSPATQSRLLLVFQGVVDETVRALKTKEHAEPPPDVALSRRQSIARSVDGDHRAIMDTLDNLPDKPQILVVDDQPLTRMVVTSLLSKACPESTLDVAENGEEAVAQAKKKNYDLILMDINMPKMDGLRATKAIRAREKDGSMPASPILGARSVPIVAITASTYQHLATCLDAGMNDMLQKPFSLAKVQGVLERFVPHWKIDGTGSTVSEEETRSVSSDADPKPTAKATSAALPPTGGSPSVRRSSITSLNMPTPIPAPKPTPATTPTSTPAPMSTPNPTSTATANNSTTPRPTSSIKPTPQFASPMASSKNPPTTASPSSPTRTRTHSATQQATPITPVTSLPFLSPPQSTPPPAAATQPTSPPQPAPGYDEVLNVEVVEMLQGLGILQNTVRTYLTQTRTLLNEITAQARTLSNAPEERKRFRGQVHALKGISYNTGAQLLGKLCERIELNSSDMNRDSILQLLVLAEETFKHTERYLKETLPPE